MPDIDELIKAANTVIGNIRKRRPDDKIRARFLGVGHTNVGIIIEDAYYWSVKTDEIINNILIPEDGVVIKYRMKITDTTFRYIKNNFYDE
jgi:hypothetical protein